MMKLQCEYGMADLKPGSSIFQRTVVCSHNEIMFGY